MDQQQFTSPALLRGSSMPCLLLSRIRLVPGRLRRLQPPATWQAGLLLLAALLLAGCAHTYTFGPSDDGKTAQVQQGDSVVLELTSNPSTGYHWVIEQNDSAKLPLQSDKYTSDNSGAIGGGGTETFTFKAMQPGTISLALQYQGPRVQNPPIADTFTLTVQIA